MAQVGGLTEVLTLCVPSGEPRAHDGARPLLVAVGPHKATEDAAPYAFLVAVDAVPVGCAPGSRKGLEQEMATMVVRPVVVPCLDTDLSALVLGDDVGKCG